MENFGANSGLNSVLNGQNVPQQAGSLWRPWTGISSTNTTHIPGNPSAVTNPKASQVVHPVKLFWPKSRCFDYLYRDAEMLLRNYPVQATICPYQDTSSDEESEDEEEEMEKELN